MILASINGTTWLMTLMGIGVVFVILVVLVLVLQIFSVTAKKTTKVVVAGAGKVEGVAKKVNAPSEEDMNAVAVAVALYLNLNDTHDYESGVLTIKHPEHSEWHSVLNTRL